MTRVSLLDGSHLQPWRQNIRHQSHCRPWFKAGIRVTRGAECLDSLAERFISEQKCLWHVFWRWRLQYRLSSDFSHFTQFSAGELWDRIFSYVRIRLHISFSARHIQYNHLQIFLDLKIICSFRSTSKYSNRFLGSWIVWPRIVDWCVKDWSRFGSESALLKWGNILTLAATEGRKQQNIFWIFDVATRNGTEHLRIRNLKEI